MIRRSEAIKVIIVLVLMAAAVLLVRQAALGGRAKDNAGKERTLPEVERVQPYTIINGQKCQVRPNLESLLVIGTDRTGPLTDIEDKDTEETMRSDTLLLLVVNKQEDTYGIIPINRNTMLNVRSLTKEGEVEGISEVQASFAYAGGYTREQSCENAAWSVSDFLYGFPVDHSVAFSISAIGVLNHAAGGVEVKINDDFSKADKSLKKGQTVKLTDEQADAFVHGRMSVGDGTNENRMSRQEQFMAAWGKQMRKQYKDNADEAAKVFDELGDLMYTDMLKGDLSRFLKAYLSDKDLGIYEIDGEIGEDAFFKWATFTADEKSKEQIAMEMLFEPYEE